MIQAGVIGHPVSHSKSPLIHQHWMDRYAISGNYTAIDIAPDRLPGAIQDLIRKGYAGFNVTVPHKVAIMKLCHEIESSAKIIGAVNTVVIQDGKLQGRNTDAFGFIENMKAALPDFSCTQPVTVLGAGGAARAVIHALLHDGAPRIAVCNRSLEKAEVLQTMAPDRITVRNWEDRAALSGCGLLINTTSLGMKGQPPLEIDLAELSDQAVVYDIVYAPLLTDLLKQAQAKGCRIVTGIGMLLHQARPAFHAWTGIMPEVDEALTRKVLA